MKWISAFVAVSAAVAASAATVEVEILEGESWWGGAVIMGNDMPYTAKSNVEGDML